MRVEDGEKGKKEIKSRVSCFDYKTIERAGNNQKNYLEGDKRKNEINYHSKQISHINNSNSKIPTHNLNRSSP